MPTRRGFLGCAAAGVGIAAAPIREAPEEVVPLRTVYATIHQEPQLELPWKRILDGDKERQERMFCKPIGPSNLFLVLGPDIEAAVGATYSVFVHGLDVDRPRTVGGPRKEEDQLWMVVYFGDAQSSPQEWTVTRVAIQDERVRMTISRLDRTKPQDVLFDRRVYMVWAPLGKRKEKALTLAVYDETNKATVMTRWVSGCAG